jgi:TIR domain
VLGGVFISYRREDSGGYAGRISDRLNSCLGRDNVFFDVDAIPPGRDFVDVLSERVGKCDALIAVIGKHWTSSVDDDNRRRLDDPNDFVRVEIAAALERKVTVIPVLVDGATMPQAVDLPDVLKSLTRRQAIQISLTSFEADAKRLTDALAKIEEEQSGNQPAAATRPSGPAPLVSGTAAAMSSVPPGPRVRAGLLLYLLLPAVAIVAAGAWIVGGGKGPGDAWLTLPAFQAEFDKKVATGLYPDASSGRCDGGVTMTNAHWATTPPGLAWFHYNLPEGAFVTKNSQLTGQGFSLRYDNMFKDCDGQTRHVALWTKG